MKNYLIPVFAITFLLQSALFAKDTSLKKLSDDDKKINEILNRYEHEIYFTQNKGQWNDEVLYKVDFKFGQAVATAKGMLLGTYEPESINKIYDRSDKEEEAMHNGKPFNEPKVTLKGHNWLMNFVNSSKSMKIETKEQHADNFNYFMDRDPSKLVSGVGNFQEIWYKNVYDKVDVRYYPSSDGQLEYDIVCKPGFNKQNIAIQFDGIDKISINENGILTLNTSIGDVAFPKPYVYQNINGIKKTIDAKYVVENNNLLKFDIGEYNAEQPLIIDPIALRWATWLTNNSAGDNHGHGVWVDESDGSLYALARIVGSGLITTLGAYQTASAGNLDIVLGKYTEPTAVNQSGTRVWQTYLGGNQDDNPYAIEMGPDGNLYITGYTYSTNFPLIGGTAFTGTGSSLDNRTQSTANIFVTKINKAGNSIKSAVIGGNGATEESYDLRTTPSGDIIVCGHTNSTNLAILYPGSGASNTNNGGTDVLVFKINQNLTAISWMRNYGGSGDDRANIMLNNHTNGDIYVAGQTTSSNFPMLNARQTSRGGSQAGFIQKLNTSGTTLWSSYFSSAASQTASILCMEFNTTKNKLYFGGLTSGLNSSNISASGVYDNSPNGGNDFFVCRMDTSQLFNVATYLGGSSAEDNMMGLNTDANNDVYIFGYTPSTNFPVTTDALQSTNQGSSDKTFSKLNANLNTLLYSTYYGGASNDYDPVGERGIKFSNCRIYTLVTARSTNIPLTLNALNTTKLSSTSIYEPGIVIWANPPDLLGNSITPSQNICLGSIPSNLTGSVPSYSLPTLIRNGTTSSYPPITTPITYQWQISTDSINWTNISGATSQNLAGSAIGAVFQNTFIRRIIGGDACVVSGPSDQIISLKIIDITGTVTNINCSGSNSGAINITPINGTPVYTYLWSDGSLSQNRTGLAPGTYIVTVTDSKGCTATKSFTVVNLNIKPEIIAQALPATICKGQSSKLSFSPKSGLSVIGWFNNCSASGTNLGTNDTLSVTPLVNSSYSVVVQSTGGCRDTACVTVNVEGTPPVITCPPPKTINCNTSSDPTITGIATATDNSSLPANILITYKDFNNLNSCGGTGTIIRRWYATDECGNKDSCNQAITVQDTTKPVFVEQLPGNITVNCNAVPIAPTLTATDNCGQATVIYGESRANGNCANNYVLTRTWTAKDACNNTTIHVQTVTVQDTTKPVFVEQLPGNITVNCNAVPTAPTLTATDNCGQATVIYGESRANGNCANNYVLTRTWTAKDACNNTTIHVQTVTVQDTTKPVFVEQLPGNITVNCNAVPIAPTLTATDNCGQATVIYGESRANGNCANNYVLTRTWTAKDACNNTTIHVQTVTVQDTTKPLFVEQLPGNITVNCNAVPTAPTLTATDNCGQATVIYGESRANGNCANNYVLTRTWTAKDACNNTTIHVQTVTVQDTTKPLFVEQLPGNITVNCNAVPIAPTLTATDNCGQATVIYGESRANGNCANNYVLTRTWTAKDACNNTTIHVQTVTVQDTTKPLFVEQLPGNITVNCNAVPTAPTLTATDNCGQATVIYNETTTPGGCVGSGGIIRTWTAKDACNNTTIHVQTVTVQDTTKPVFVEQLPGNITVNCNAVPTAPTLTATDNCGQATVIYGESRANGNCANNYVLTRTWTAKDACNNTTIHVQTVTVQDTTKPVFVEQLPGNITVNCNAVPTAPTLTATDNCGQATVIYGESRANGNCANSYVLTRTWTAKDACNNTTIHVQTVTVQDTTKPVFVEQLPGNITVNCNAVPTAPTLTATDNCGQATVIYGESRVNGNCANNYVLTRTWTAKDACNNTTIHVQTVTVQDTTKPVFVEQLPGNITVNCNAVPTAPTLTATDNCGQATVIYNETTTPGGCVGSGGITRTWTAKDACNNTTIHVQTVTVQDTTKPVFVEQLPSNITVNCNAVPTAPTLTATDNCGQATVIYGESRVNGNCANNYVLTRTWTAKDACNNTTIHVQTVTVQDTTNPVFIEQLPGNITVNCNAVPTAPTLTATDNCGQATVIYGESRANGNCANNYVLTRTWTAKDACNNTTIHVQTVTVQDTTKPVFVEQLPGNITVNCDAVPIAPTFTATDNCGQATVIYGESRANGNCANNYVLTRTWTAKDACNNTTIHVQTVTVQDTTKPVFVEQLPGNITVNCNAVPIVPTLTATDNCGQATVIYGESRANGNCANSYVLTRTWTAKDACNNTTIHVQTVTVQDTTKPVFVEQLPGNITVNCNAVPIAPTLTATDNCGQATVIYGESRANGNCANNYVLTRTWTAKDACNNTTIHVQTVTVQDTTKPLFVEQLPGNITVNCNAVPIAPTLTATDNCGQATVIYGESRANGNCANNYVLTRTWTAKDACNNTTIHVQTVTVQDTTKPLFVEQLPGNITVNCNAVPTAPTLTATDNCGQATVIYNETTTPGGCVGSGGITRTWTAKDACNNTTIHVQTVTVQDTTKPVFVEQLPGNITVNCNAVPIAPTLTATDNCGQATVIYGESRANGNCANNYVLTRTWTAKDACNNTTIHVQTVTVQDTIKPVITGTPENITVSCAADVPTASIETVTATDNCAGTVTKTVSDETTQGNCANKFTVIRTWTATDVCGNASSTSQTITVNDTIKPVITGTPENITVSCASDVPTASIETVTATDNCAGTVTKTVSDETTQGNCANKFTVIRTWTATDVCGNASSTSQTITVNDTIKPVITGTPENITVSCASDVPTASIETVTATDNCAGTVTKTVSDETTQGNCANKFTVIRTWTATDVCGNTSSTSQTITVNDTIKPVITGTPENITVSCASDVPTASIETVTATDNCAGTVTKTVSDETTQGNCANKFTVIRTWTATDVCGNASSTSQTITVNDTIKPLFNEELPQDITVCAILPQAPILTATDNCGIATVVFNESVDSVSIPNVKVYTRTWTATDICFNSTDHKQIITFNQILYVSKSKTICEGEYEILGDNSYGITGIYTQVFASANECDSIVTLNLTVNPVKRTNIDAVICFGEKIIVGEQIFTTSITNQIIKLSTSEECDSIIILNLVVLKQDTIETNRSICLGDFTEIDGHIFTSPGTYYIPFANHQCSGIVKLNLSVLLQSESSLTRTICEGETLTIGGEVFSTTGFYTINKTNTIGCDSIITLNLIVNPRTSSIINEIICDGESFAVGSQTYNLNGTYNINLTNTSGCDSIVTLNLIVLSNEDTTNISQSICEGDTTTVNGQIFTESGTYYIPVTNGECSSIVELNLNVNIKSITKFTKSICEGDAVTIGNQTFNESGVYTIELQNSTGCDSIITLVLDVSNGGTMTHLDTTLCFGELITFAGQTFSSTGTYRIIYPAEICRDTLLLNLTVNPHSDTIIRAAICDTITSGGITVAGQVYSEPGTYNITIPNSIGCDSSITLVLSVTICIPLSQDTIIYDTLPVSTTKSICELSLPPDFENVVVKSCDGTASGTSVHGTWTIDIQTNCLVFTAGPIEGTDSLCMIACDTITRQCNTTTVFVTVTGLPPIANDDCAEETEKNKEITINVLDNDSDPDQDRIFISSIITQPKYGNVTIDQEGQVILYTPFKNYCGRDTFYYEVCDGDDGCDTATVCIYVKCDCILPQVITPNNDGFNDNLFFPCITGIDGVKLLVWHRWGLIVYEDNNYKNDWKGTLKGELLPAGTYWYSIEYKNPETQEDVKEVNYFMIIN